MTALTGEGQLLCLLLQLSFPELDRIVEVFVKFLGSKPIKGTFLFTFWIWHV